MISSLLLLSLAASPNESALKAQLARFAPTEIRVDLKSLPASERAVLPPLLRAAGRMDSLYLAQVWAGNAQLLLDLSQDATPLGKARLHDFIVNKGPWSRLDGDAPFLPGIPPKPAEASYYPSDSRAEVDKLIKGATGDLKQQVTSFYTVGRRTESGALVFLPYSSVYQEALALVATDLREAAKATQQPSLRTFLEARAAALLSNDYRASDIAWMDLDSSIEPTLGPYEVYEDGWFNLKAAFEAFISITDAAETKKLQSLGARLQDLEDHLPIDHEYRNPKLGSAAPIKVVNEIFCAGDANHGVQTAAYNLPNDEEITRAKGTKRVMLKNVQEAKFQKVLLPISKQVLSPAAQKHVSFEAFFTHILMHELMHGLGPHEAPPGSQKTVREALGNTYGTLEEAKADISGLWALQQLVDKGALPKSLEQSMYSTFLASAFRTLRFGLNEAHGRGQALQLNYLLDKGAFRKIAGCRFEVDESKVKDGVRDLTHDIMTLQAEGNRAKAESMLSTLGVIRPDVKCALDRLGKIPVDIEPKFVTAEGLLKE